MFFMMPKAMKEKWVAALRSGEYRQATGALTKDGGFCCLGVLQCVVDGEVEHEFADLPSGWWCKKSGLREGDGDEFYVSQYADDDSADLQIESGVLSQLNDGDEAKGIKPLTFSEIADLIEKEVPVYGD
jgi:hypothetical protein